MGKTKTDGLQQYNILWAINQFGEFWWLSVSTSLAIRNETVYLLCTISGVVEQVLFYSTRYKRARLSGATTSACTPYEKQTTAITRCSDQSHCR